MKNLSAVYLLAMILIIVGGLNWGLVGAFGFNLVDTLFGVNSLLSKVVYMLVGLSAFYAAATLIRSSDKGASV